MTSQDRYASEPLEDQVFHAMAGHIAADYQPPLPTPQETGRLPQINDSSASEGSSYFFEYDDHDGLKMMLNHRLIRTVLQERDRNHHDNISWLDEDLHKKEEARRELREKYPVTDIKTYAAARGQLGWLDRSLDDRIKHDDICDHVVLPDQSLDDISEKRHQENISWLDQDLKSLMEEEDQRKVWHCGHGARWFGNTPEERVEKRRRINQSKLHYAEGLEGNTCVIHHGTPQHSSRGNNTYKQFKTFESQAKKGDTIFISCSSMGGLTHWGIFTGEIRTVQRMKRERGKELEEWSSSYMTVEKWIPLNSVRPGVGKNCTLYEVTPMNKSGKETKNYNNYKK